MRHSVIVKPVELYHKDKLSQPIYFKGFKEGLVIQFFKFKKIPYRTGEESCKSSKCQVYCKDGLKENFFRTND